MTNNTQPSIGDIVIVRGLKCEIVRILPMGTIEVSEIDGPHAFRVSGLKF